LLHLISKPLFASRASRAPLALDTTPIGHLRACRELASLYVRILARRLVSASKCRGRRSQGAPQSAVIGQVFASALAVRRRNHAQGSIGVAYRIEEGFSLHPNVDLLDFVSTPAYRRKRRFRDPVFLLHLISKPLFASRASRAPLALDTTPIGRLCACRELVSLYNGIFGETLLSASKMSGWSTTGCTTKCGNKTGAKALKTGQ
jgi:hypothetical protein